MDVCGQPQVLSVLPEVGHGCFAAPEEKVGIPPIIISDIEAAGRVNTTYVSLCEVIPHKSSDYTMIACTFVTSILSECISSLPKQLVYSQTSH